MREMQRRLQRTERILQGIVILIGFRCAMAGRNLPIESDGIAYLDVARAYLRHDWRTAVNGYWGPLYSWLLAAMELIFKPDPCHEFAAVRGVNFAIFILCVCAFGSFWRSVAGWSKKIGNGGNGLSESSPVVWLVLGYLLLATKVSWLVEEVTPDLLVSSIVLLTCSQLFKLYEARSRGLIRYAAFGLLLALGFYAKAILLYFAVFVLLAMILKGASSRTAPGPIMAAAVFILLVSPYVAVLSRTLGHFSMGEAGRLNYSWFVDGTETGPWAEGGVSMPFFPGPVLLDSPRVFGIPHMPGVTYAPWYDPARFDKHTKASFSFSSQVRQIAVNAKLLKEEILGSESALLVCLIILICFAPQSFRRTFVAAWFCSLPVCLIIIMYLLIHLVNRFTFGFLLVLWGVSYANVRVPPGLETLARRALLAGTLIFALSTLPGMMHLVFSRTENPLNRDLLIAQAMPEYGIRPEDSVALIGNGDTAYWAYWARLSIVAEVPSTDAPQFWSASTESQNAALQAMKEAGAKSIIWSRDSDRPCLEHWVSLPGDSGCMIDLHVSEPRGAQ
jgi:hypothetical protein